MSTRGATRQRKRYHAAGKAAVGAARLALLALAAGASLPAAAAPPEPVDVLSVSSTATTLEIVHGPMPPGVRRSVFKLDNAEGFWQRLKRGVTYDAATRTWTDPFVTLGHECCYRIVTRNESGEQSQGERACGVFDGGDASLRPPAAATQLEIVRSEPNLHVLSFSDESDNETGFEILRQSEAKLGWNAVATLPASDGTGAVLEVADEGVDMEIRYCYRVRTLGEQSHALSGTACALTPPVTSEPADSPRQPRPFVIRRPGTRTLNVSWSDNARISQWSVWLYDAADLDTPIRSARVRERRSPPRPVQGTSFDRILGNRLYCVRIMRMNRQPDERPLLCESPHEKRVSVTQVGPRADRVPELTRITPTSEGLTLTLARPAEGQLIDLVAEDGLRFTYLGGQNGGGSVEIVDLEPETSYCVRPWIYNSYASRYGQPMCATTLPPADEPPPREVTYSTLLAAQIPPQGVIPYVHVVEPGPPRPTALLRVKVIGNAFTPYQVRFIRPQPGPFTCSLEEGDGVTVDPGKLLTGAGLATLFGSETPTIPSTGLTLIACKLLRGGGGSNTNPIPVDVTYRRP